MEKTTKVKFGICVAITALTFWLLAPTVWSLKHPDGEAKMPGWMPPTAMKLGLDLQGGIHMVMGVDLDKVVRDQLASYGRLFEREAATAKIEGVKTRVLGDKFEMEVEVAGGFVDKAADLIQKNFGNVLQVVGESGNVIVTRMTNDFEADVRSRALEQSIATIRNRIDEFGVAEPIITRKGDSQILVQFPGAKEPERLKGLIGQTAQLTFQIVHECVRDDGSCLARQQTDLMTKIKDAEKKGNYTRETFKQLSEYRKRVNEDLKASLPAETTISFQKDASVNVNNGTELRPFLLSTKNVLSGEYIENAYVTLDRGRNQIGPEQPVVSFQLNAAGGPMLANLTTEFEKHYMAIVLDGVVKSAPVIQTPITGGQGQITLGRGSLDEMNKEARDLSIVLRAGALPATIEIQEERTIGPSLGADAIQAGGKALVLASAIIFIFMWMYYGASGLVANVVTLINTGMIVAILGAMGATLTLPGIAGIVLTLGMAIDALIIIYERMREELRLGRNRRQVVELGFEHAFSTILDSNVTTAIGAFVLLQYGTGSIRGFALTLLVGIVANVFMATFFTKALYQFFLEMKSGDKHIGIGLSRKELAEITA